MSSRVATQRWVGVFLIFGLCLIVACSAFLLNWEQFRNPNYPIELTFKNATGIIKGSQVRIGGAIVGKVSAAPTLNSDGRSVRVPLRLNESVKIPKGSEFRIASLSLLGDRYIDIVPNSQHTEEFLQAGDIIQGRDFRDLAALEENVSNLSTSALETLKRVDKALVKLDSVADSINRTAHVLHDTVTIVNSSVLTEKNISNIETGLNNFAQFSTSLKNLPEKWDKAFVELHETSQKINTAADTLTSSGQNLEKKLLPLIDKGADFVQIWGDNGKEINKTLKQINSPKKPGLLHDLLYNQKLTQDFDYFIQNLSKQGILRYRDLRPNLPKEEPKLNDSRHQGRRL